MYELVRYVLDLMESELYSLEKTLKQGNFEDVEDQWLCEGRIHELKLALEKVYQLAGEHTPYKIPCSYSGKMEYNPDNLGIKKKLTVFEEEEDLPF